MSDAHDPKERLSALINRFRPLAWSAAAGSICEVTGANDSGHDYCKTCARWEVRRLHREGTYPEAEVEGG